MFATILRLPFPGESGSWRGKITGATAYRLGAAEKGFIHPKLLFSTTTKEAAQK